MEISSESRTPEPVRDADGIVPNNAPASAAAPAREGATVAPSTPRLISGIDLIDYAGGGLQPEKAYLVKGSVGLGKSILGLQYLSRGLELGETGILITNQKPEAVLLQARNVGFNLDEPVKRGQLLILNTSNRYFDLVESPADVMAIVEELGDYVKTTGAQRLVIDPVYSLITTTYSSHFAVTVAQSLLNALEELPVTTILIAGDEDNPELVPVVRVLEQNSSGVIALSHDKATGGRMMRLSKMRYSASEHLASHYRILNGRGVINYRGEGEQVTDVTQPWEESAASRRSVLVLGTNPETIRKVKAALGESYEVSAESDMQRGVERAKSERPGLVLVTPSRSIESIRAVAELSQVAQSSIAFLSPSTNRLSDKVLYLRAGADDFITEPFSPQELHARVDALVRRSGRRLLQRDSSISAISADEMQSLTRAEPASKGRSEEALTVSGDSVSFAPAFRERLSRSIDTVSKLDMHFALYWIKATGKDKKFNDQLAKLCRQEDIICRNVNGEFVALLTGTDADGIRGFEARLRERLGSLFDRTQHGHSLYTPGESIESFTSKAVATTA